jgi:hypothetical protein
MDLPPQNDAFGASIGGMKKADAFFMLVLLFEVADLLQPTKKGRSQMETPPGKNQFYYHLRTFVQCITGNG